MQRYSTPLIDEQNPFYCPTVSATAYINSLRQNLRRNDPNIHRELQPQDAQLLLSFARVLDKALMQDDDVAESFGSLGAIPDSPDRGPLSDTSSEDLDYPIPAWERYQDSSESGNSWIDIGGCLARNRRPVVKRKRTSFSEIRGPPKYARSFQSVHDSSFEIDIKRENLQYCIPGHEYSSPPPGKQQSSVDYPAHDLISRIQALEDELYGPSIGPESPRGIQSFIKRLESLLPGIRLKERLSRLHDLTHQTITDFLADNGHLNARVLAILRTSEVQSISLTKSLVDEAGLNISGRDVFPVFGKPNSFLFLSELSLSGTRVRDADILHIHHLPRLSTLLLNNTGIGNEAIFLLVPLKRSLVELSIATNPHINDDAIPALLLLSRLTFLSILDTSIDMDGLRSLARTINLENRVIDIEIPSTCDRYVDAMGTKYLLKPLPPLVTNPDVCPQLSAAALKRNLLAHAAQNPAIVAGGTKAEMAERLWGILKTRQMDMLVRQMLQESQDEDDIEM